MFSEIFLIKTKTAYRIGVSCENNLKGSTRVSTDHLRPMVSVDHSVLLILIPSLLDVFHLTLLVDR